MEVNLKKKVTLVNLRTRSNRCTLKSLSKSPGMCLLAIMTMRGTSKHRSSTATGLTDGKEQLKKAVFLNQFLKFIHP